MMNLTQCPYDGAQVETEAVADGTLVLTCAACGAAWERRGGWAGRVREPDPMRMMAARLGMGSRLVSAEPLPMVIDTDPASDSDI